MDRKKRNPKIEKSSYENIIKRFNEVKNSKGNVKISDIRLEMQEINQNYCPVYRSEKKMIQGKEKLLQLLDKFKKIKIKDKTNVWNTEVIEALE